MLTLQPARLDLDLVPAPVLHQAAVLLVQALAALAVNKAQYHVRRQAVALLLLVPVVEAAAGRLDVQ